MARAVAAHAVRRAAWALVALALVACAVTIVRVPIPWIDEIYIASAAASSVRGGSGVSSILTPGLAFVPLDHVYGPFFFWLATASVRLFGVTLLSVRLVCLIGVAGLTAAAAWLVRAVGARREWAAIAAALVVLSPEVGTIATNGRMDSVALALEIAGFAGLAAALTSTTSGRRHAASVVAAASLLFASWTTPRTLPVVGVVVVLVAALAALRRRRTNAVAPLAWLVAILAIGWLWWLAHLGFSPLGWLRWQVGHTERDALDRAVAGVPRQWGFDVRNGVTPLVTLMALGATTALALARRRVPVSLPDRLTPVLVALTAATVNAGLYVVFANRVFVSGWYFTTPLLIMVLAASVVMASDGGYERILVVAWLAVVLLFAAGRVAKEMQVYQTWAFRDPAPLERFVETHVPSGSIVYGYDQYYFFAVEHSGSTFRTFALKPETVAPIVIGDGFDASSRLPDPPGVRRYLLWPVNGPGGEVPAAFRCAMPHPIATFRMSGGGVGVERLGVFDPALHGYPDTVLYELGDGCYTSSFHEVRRSSP